MRPPPLLFIFILLMFDLLNRLLERYYFSLKFALIIEPSRVVAVTT